LVGQEQLIEPDPCPEPHILRVHDPSYWEKLKNFKLSDRERRRLGIPLHSNSLNRARSSAFGTLSAARSALRDGIAFNLGGGTHHAFFAHGEAYSMVNDLAIAAHGLLDEGSVKRVLVLDLDVHQGNGTASLMEREDRVYTFSMHGADNYPFRKARSDRDLAFPSGTGDEAYLRVLERELHDLFRRISPDIILYQAGVDVLAGDRLGTLALSKDACRERDRMVFEASFREAVPIAVTMGGGYSERVAELVDAHTATFRTGILAWST
jgi:acetoin utilization deacetylase AcuC-like enzyme